MIPHIHDFSGWSCVYYHKVCCDKTPLIFSHLVPQINHQTLEFVPKNGSLVFLNNPYLTPLEPVDRKTTKEYQLQ